MAEFKMKIAGQTAAVRSLFESTRDYCRCYLTEDAPDFFIPVTEEDIRFEQAELDAEALEEGFRLRRFTDPFLERTAIQRKFAEHLFDRDVLMLHGSAVALDGEGYLFTARSGTGKSTHTRLWRQVFGERAVMVNDDKPFLQITASGVLVCGSPWSGKHGLDTNITVPLKGICFLKRGPENRIRKAAPQEMLPMLLHQGYCPLDPEKQQRFRELAAAVAEQTPLWHLECNRDPHAAEVACRHMSAPASSM